jgi:hypothetical protein
LVLRESEQRPLTWLAPLATLSPGRGQRSKPTALSFGERVPEVGGQAYACRRGVLKPGFAGGYLLRKLAHYPAILFCIDVILRSKIIVRGSPGLGR